RQHAEKQLAGTDEERAWHRQHYGAQLEETKRYHNLLDNFNKGKLEEKRQKANKLKEHSYLDKIAPAINTPSSLDKVITKTGEAADFYHEVETIQDKHNELIKLMEKNGIDVNNPLAFNSTINDISNLTSSFTRDPKKRE